MRRQLAVELESHGIRVVTLQSGGVPETTREEWREAITQNFVATSMLKQVETLEPHRDHASLHFSSICL